MSGNEISSPDSNSLRYACDHLDLPELSLQQQRFLLGRFRGLAIAVAARSAGWNPTEAKAFEQTDMCQALLTYLHDHVAHSVGITRDRLTVMLLDAHDLAATSGERVSAIRELGQLHDLYPQKSAAQVNVQINNNQITSEKQVQRLDDNELLRLAGGGLVLEPEPNG